MNDWIESETLPPSVGTGLETAVFQTLVLCKPFLSGGITVPPYWQRREAAVSMQDSMGQSLETSNEEDSELLEDCHLSSGAC